MSKCSNFANYCLLFSLLLYASLYLVFPFFVFLLLWILQLNEFIPSSSSLLSQYCRELIFKTLADNYDCHSCLNDLFLVLNLLPHPPSSSLSFSLPLPYSTQTRTRTNTHAYTHIYIYSHPHSYTYTCTYTLSHTCTYTHARIHPMQIYLYHTSTKNYPKD